VISFRVNPLRDGTNFGASVGALAKCPVDAATKKPKLPEAGTFFCAVQRVIPKHPALL